MNDYTKLDKILNEQFLGNNSLSEFLYKRIISKGNINKNDISCKNFVFITGLARAGTTAILNQLYNSRQFSSLLYKHMPFILSPRLAKISSNLVKKETIKKQRLHGDGLMINYASPECLDEIFWIKSQKDYYKKNLNVDDKIDLTFLNGYEYLLTSYSNSQDGKRIIIKNNNNHIRIKYLTNYFRKSIFLIIFRNPIFHSYSLLKTHKRFCKLQEKDPYILEYMNLIGHREFGLGLKIFHYKNTNNMIKYRPSSINFWLQQWINCYNWILSNKLYKKSNVKLINYEKLCLEDNNLKELYDLLQIKIHNKNELILKNKLSNEGINDLNIDPSLKNLSMCIYSNLKKFNFKIDKPS